MHVRRYQPGDAAALIAMKRETICRINSRDYTPKQIQAWVPDETALANWPGRVSDRFVIVAEEDGQPIGFADVGSDGHIDQFFVHADHQRKGVGGAMLAALVAEAVRIGITRLFSEVSITARPFFEMNGFRVDGRQVVAAKGVEFVNFRMSREMAPAEAD